MKKIVATTVLAVSAVALFWSAPTAQAQNKSRLVCLHYQDDSFEPGPSKRGDCIIYQNRYLRAR